MIDYPLGSMLNPTTDTIKAQEVDEIKHGISVELVNIVGRALMAGQIPLDSADGREWTTNKLHSHPREGLG